MTSRTVEEFVKRIRQYCVDTKTRLDQSLEFHIGAKAGGVREFIDLDDIAMTEDCLRLRVVPGTTARWSGNVKHIHLTIPYHMICALTEVAFDTGDGTELTHFKMVFAEEVGGGMDERPYLDRQVP
jgi:hypothetical protein